MRNVEANLIEKFAAKKTGNVHLNRRIILKCIFKKEDMKIRSRFFWLRIGRGVLS
jgi:hypothetical protein